MENQGFVILITQKGMGHGPAELQLTLLEKYLMLLLQNGSLPSSICFYTEGVKLLTEASPILEKLLELEKKKVRLVACSTCLGYYGLEDQLKAGVAGSMADILEAQLKAEKVISI